MQHNPDSGGHRICLCGRSFLTQGALNKHERSCHKSRKRLSNAINRAKQIWTGRKRQKLDHDNHTVDLPLSAGLAPEPLSESQATLEPMVEDSTSSAENSNLSMMERRPWGRRLNRQLPLRFRDVLPLPPPSLPPAHILQSTTPESLTPPILTDSDLEATHSSGAHIGSRTRHFFETPINVFGLSRRYYSQEIPSYDPEEQLSLEDFSSIPARRTAHSPQAFYPYPNRSAFSLGDWFWNGGVQKSQASFNNLMDIICDPEFLLEDVQGVKWNHINAELATDREEWLDEDAGWTRTQITISVPYQIRRGIPSVPDAGPRCYVAGDLFHRNLVSVIREKISGLVDSHSYHFEPYELLWHPTKDQEPIRIQGELYSSPAFIDAHRELQGLPGEPGCNLPRVVAPLMFWSDATQLATFSNAKLWPLYLFFGGDSKYRRCKPSCHLCEHVAYFQTLPDAFKDFATTQTAGGKTPSSEFMTHCSREFMHEQWKILLDDDFINAWKFGIVILCWDGIKRRFYPRIFTYSADYPEKILLASIRNRGHCPCPRCLIPLDRLHNLGMTRDSMQRVTMARVDDIQRRNRVYAARRLIYEKNFQVNSAAVESLLQEQSFVPNMNAFSDKLSPLGFNLFRMLVPDLMHEVELGVWKALFIHLLRILETQDERLLAELDRRYREIPSFGRDTIRRFSKNCSEMKKMTAHDFENLLQCSITVFDGLLPEPHNRVVMELLFTMAHWHGLAKLRMHNDKTLAVMDTVTVSLGNKFRAFVAKTCPAFETRELRREFNTRVRRQTRQSAPKGAVTSSNSNIDLSHPMVAQNHSHPENGSNVQVMNQASSNSHAIQSASGGSIKPKRRRKAFNINTYKYHSFGDYVETIRRIGTMDSFSTEPGELEHRSPKARYRRTTRKNFIKQLTQIERRQARLRRIRNQYQQTGRPQSEDTAITPEVHHVIAKSQNHPEPIPLFLRRNAGDPAAKDFIPKLKDHILPRIKDMLAKESTSNPNIRRPQSSLSVLDSNLPSQERDSVLFKSDRIYKHHLVRLNFTTYDVRRAQDVVNPDTQHCDIMLLANTDDEDNNSKHPFLYARVLAIYHVNVIYTGEGMLDYNARRVDVLWVRWFEYDGSRSLGWDDLKLDSVRFPPMASEGAFGFVDPSDVLRGCHIVPAFAEGRARPDGVGLSRCARDAHEWSRYCINRFVDRDMIMRYHWGLAVGHIYSHERSASIPVTPTAVQSTADATGLTEETTDGADFISHPLRHENDLDVDDPELSFEYSDVDDEDDRQDDLIESSDDEMDREYDDDEELLLMDDMYGLDSYYSD